MIFKVCCRFQRKLIFVFLLFICHILSTYGQGYFPKLVDLAELKPITSTSTCGATSSKYCQSSTRQTSLQTCVEETCKFDCCVDCGSSKPVPSDLAERSNKFGVTQDGDPRNGTIIRSFRFQGDSYIQPLRVPAIDYVNPGFTISVWIKQKKGNKGTIISKDENIAPDYSNIFQVVIQDYNLMFYYRPTIGNASIASYTLLQSQSQKLQADEWHLITVAVINKGLSYYIDGELMNANVATLTGPILDSGGGVRIGQKYGGDAEWQYEGLMQDIFIYNRALTNREAIEAFTGVLPFAYVASSCRCPPTHPKINVAEPAKCLKNLEGDLDTVSRLADTAHPIEFATDGDTLSFWLSEITNNVIIDINLSYSGLQVFYIVLTFYGPVPGGLEILRSTDNGRTFHPWQYFAEDCVSSFGLKNNGPLTQPDSVNCLQYVKPLQSSRDMLTFQTEYPPPPGSNIPVRPFGQGCSNLYCSESQLRFLKATHVKIRFHNHTLAQNAQHKYYGLERILITGRCECFGHASSISYVEGNSTHPGHCVCDCHSSTSTEGETCNRCKPLYNNKPFQRGDQDDSYPCVKCECNEHASSCVYNQSLDTSPNSRTQGGGGVCIDCQHNTTGQFCEACKERFYRESGKSLKSPDVCSPCRCEGPGVQSGKLDCVKNDSDSNVLAGQCECKAKTQGRQCDVCEDGYFDLKASHATGCVACGCVLDGTKNRNISCHATSGQCDCKDRVTGTKCDTCMPGFWGLSGFYNLSQSNPQGCTQCACDTNGTVGGSGQCQQQSGNCICKPFVIGRSCNQCMLGTYGLNQSNPNGCQPCNCFPKGTRDGDIKRPDELPCTSNGQCFCLSSVSGLRCDSCVADYYWNPTGQGCVQCNCNPVGSVGRNCNDTGHCTCKANIAGRRCDRCTAGYYGLATIGSCTPCNCNAAGSLTNKCNERGECGCKDNVEGVKCDQCKNGTINLQQNNKYGCSGAPSEQPAPFVTVLSSRAMMLTWFPPDNPNGVIVRYELYRNDSLVYSGLNQTYNDSSLTPDTVYRYYIITYTVSGQTRSLDDGKVYGTFQDAPDDVSAPVITDIQPRNATVSWQPPSVANGFITEYRLISTNSRNAVEVVNCRGIIFMCQLGDLRPYTVYNFMVEACTNGGCARSNATTILTLPTLPDFQPAPNVTSLPGGTAVKVEWDEPTEPNGRILRYELYMRAAPFTSGGVLKFNSNPAHDLNQINFRKTNVTGLIPFTEYEFIVRTFTAQVRGGRAGEWTRHKTGEGTPLGENAMNVGASSFNSSSVVVSWSPPQTPQGVITSYIVYKYQPPSSLTAVRAAELPGSQWQGVVAELTPYTEYKFTVKACNSFACSGHSPEALAQTLPAAPEGQGQPTVLSVDSSTVYLKWSQPQTPNGPLPPSYNLSRAYSALYFPPPLVTAGVHFPGLGYYKFPSDFVRPGASNDIQFWFRTQYAFGLLLFLVSDGSQTDMLVVELRDGKPWLIFDCQDGPAAFTISQSVRFDDGEWHQLKVKRVSRRGTLTVDGYQASQDSPGTATVISTNTGVYIGGLPSTFTLLRQDTGNAKLKRDSFIGCLRGITSDSRQPDWTSGLEAVSVEPQRNGCPARDKKKAILLLGGGYVAIDSTGADIFTSDIFSFTLIFRTQLSSGLLLFAYGPTTTFAIRLEQNQIEIMYVTSTVQGTVTVTPSSGEICDGRWHNVTITNFLGVLTVTVDTNTVGRPGITNLVIQNIFYIGGVPWGSPAETVAQQAGVNVESSFGGCIMVQSIAKEIDYQTVVTAMYNAELDGCLPDSTIAVSGQVGKCFPFNSSVVFSGETEMFNDSSVDVFTDYLYRVDSYHGRNIGSAKSAWIASRSGQGAPAGLQAPAQLIPLPGGKTVRVVWTPPERPNGIISEYRILSYRVQPPHATADETVIADASVLNATITALQPYTMYEIRIEVFTVVGSAVGPGKKFTTEESVPESVLGATAVRRPKELEVHWSEPGQPNGVIIQYNLTLDGQVVYSGTNNNFTIQGLLVYTEYALQLTACTRIGCAQGPVVRIRTGELPPEGVKVPWVLVRGRTEVEVSWEVPRILNGEIVRYEILFATSDVLSAYVSKFNATPDVFNTVIGNLTAGTLYYVRVRPFTGGGGTFSNATQVQTHEDIPDDIPVPTVVADSPYALSVIMLPPDKPNGVITCYELYQDSITDPVLSVTQPTNYKARGLAPYSRHTFRVRACTAQGCAYCAQAVAFTQEIAPNGTVTLTTSIRNATAVNARWTRVAVPNGRLFYSLMVYGRFIVQGSVELESEQRIETAISVEEAEKDFIYNGLLPYTTFTFWVNASNSVGFVLSNSVTDSTPEGVPEGFSPPALYSLSRTEIRVSWNPPTEPNGVVIQYKIYVNDALWTNAAGVERQAVASGLEPFTYYVIKVAVCTTHGCTMSDPASATTDAAVDITRNTSAVVNVTEGESLTVNCSIGTDDPFWSRKDGGDVDTKTRKRDGVLLRIENASIADTGVYVCKHGKDQHTIWIQVLVQVEVEMELVVENYVFTEELKNKSSPEYKETEKNFTIEMDKVHRGVTPGYVRTDVLGFKKGSVQVDFKIVIVLVTNDPENETDLPDVKAETAQRVVVKAKTGFVERLQVKKVIVKTVPLEPANVEFFGIDSDELSVRWNPSEDADSFQVQRYEVHYRKFEEKLFTNVSQPASDGKTQYTIRIQPLEPETTYMIQVGAANDYGRNFNDESAHKTDPAPFAWWIIVVVVFIVLLVLVILVVLIVYKRKRDREREALQQGPRIDALELESAKHEIAAAESKNVKGLSYSYHNDAYKPSEVSWEEIPYENLKLLDELGSGAFGVVYKAEYLQENGNVLPCAVKSLKPSASSQEVHDLFNELEIMDNVGYHPNLVNLIGACTEDGHLLVVLEIAENGSLIEFLKKNRQTDQSNEIISGLTEQMKTRVATDVARGMAHLAKCRCIHRDLAARNVLLGKDYVAKVSDYGMARDVYEDLMYKKETQGKLPVKWMAIESLQTYIFTIESDVWSYGVLLWEIESGGLKPYAGLNTTELMEELKKGYRLEKPAGCSEDMYQVMRSCWNPNPSARPTFDQLVIQLESEIVT